MASPTYIVKYNGYQLPGFLQNESLGSDMTTVEHSAQYADGQTVEYTGLQNKSMSLTFRVWETDYATCKEQVQQAASIIRTARDTWAVLTINSTTRQYLAMATSIKMDKSVGSSPKILDYQVDFKCQPWLMSNSTYIIASGFRTDNDALTAYNEISPAYSYRMASGDWGGYEGIVQDDADSTSIHVRDITHGGWSPLDISLSGVRHGATIRAYQIDPVTGPTEYNTVTISGAHTWITLGSSDFSGDFAYVDQVDFRTYAAPGPFYIVVSGVSHADIRYQNRWYI